MKRFGFGLAWTIAAGALVIPATAQPGKPSAAPLAVVSTARPQLGAGAVIRQIEDPNSGLRWLLFADPAHPGGPGRLIAQGTAAIKQGAARSTAEAPAPVIRPGDPVQVEEHSAVVDTTLQAVALGAAAPGGKLRLRLRIGGRVLTARALGPGRAALEPAGGKP